MQRTEHHDQALTLATIEVDRYSRSGNTLVSLTTVQAGASDPKTSWVVLSGSKDLEELPEVLRALGLALVFADPDGAHRAVWRLLEALATSS